MILDALAPGDPRMPAFETALCDAGLPIEDLAAPDQYFFATSDGRAFGGYWRHGRTALLRSIIVLPAWRRTGLGAVLLAALLRQARVAGAEEAWLLTTTAAPFFAGHGFIATGRSSAPPAIAATAQFSTLCPNAAVLMCKTLA